jgi:hypothetical protein
MQAHHHTANNASHTKSAIQGPALMKPIPMNGKNSNAGAKIPHHEAAPTGKGGNKNSVQAKGVPQI